MSIEVGQGLGSYVEFLEGMPEHYHNLGFAAYNARLVTELVESLESRDSYCDTFLDIKHHLEYLGIDSDEHFKKFSVRIESH